MRSECFEAERKNRIEDYFRTEMAYKIIETNVVGIQLPFSSPSSEGRTKKFLSPKNKKKKVMEAVLESSLPSKRLLKRPNQFWNPRCLQSVC